MGTSDSFSSGSSMTTFGSSDGSCGTISIGVEAVDGEVCDAGGLDESFGVFPLLECDRGLVKGGRGGGGVFGGGVASSGTVTGSGAGTSKVSPSIVEDDDGV